MNFETIRTTMMSLFGIRTTTRQLPNNAQLLYSENGRDGYVRFQSDVTTFDMYWEFGGGKALALISIPTVAEWTGKTRLPLSQREEVLHFIGERVVRDKCAGGNRFSIGPDCLTIWELNA